MIIKELFDNAANGTLTYEEFLTAAGSAKFIDLSEGNYVSKKKYDDDVESKNNQIEQLNSTIKKRDADLEGLKVQLKDAGTDADKLAQLTNEFDTLKNKYDTDTKTFKAQLKKQAYEFAVRDFANSKKFTSNAAKRDFIQSMIAKDLKMENDIILGADDFVTAYSVNNEDAFITESLSASELQKPQFVNSTSGNIESSNGKNDFLNAFHFTGVRPIKTE